jgi:hypothetical protein
MGATAGMTVPSLDCFQGVFAILPSERAPYRYEGRHFRRLDQSAGATIRTEEGRVIAAVAVFIDQL